MAKTAYKIPADLNASAADMEIAIQGKDGVGIKPLPVKVILSYIASVILCFMVVTKTVVAKGSIVQIVLFCIMWAIMTFVLMKYDGTKRMQVQVIPTLINYIPKSSRRVLTRSSQPATAFYNIAGIRDINKDTGLIEFIDGTFGYWYRVVGTASILLFDDDRNAILERVDSFYRKLAPDCEVCFVTMKSAQTVYRQARNLKRRYDSLEVRDPDLKHLAQEQFDVLKNYVGGSFRSIHQYMVIKGDNREALTRCKNVIQSEAENSTLMLKQCIPMYYEDLMAVMQVIYRGRRL